MNGVCGCVGRDSGEDDVGDNELFCVCVDMRMSCFILSLVAHFRFRHMTLSDIHTQSGVCLLSSQLCTGAIKCVGVKLGTSVRLPLKC